MNSTLIYTISGCVLYGAGCFVNALAELPHPLSDDDPFPTGQINQNFSYLDTRLSTLEESSSGSANFSSYELPFSTDGAVKNVVVLSMDLDNGYKAYYVRSRYTNSTEMISINGQKTLVPYIASYAYVRTDADAKLLVVSNYIEAPDTTSYLSWNVEQSTFLPNMVKTVTSDTLRESWVCGGEASNARLCIATVTHSIDRTFKMNYGWSSIQAAAGSFAVNGIQFADVSLRAQLGRDQFRVAAKGIGLVLRVQDGGVRRLIYYRVNGKTGGSLAGTPFESGPLNGLFF